MEDYEKHVLDTVKSDPKKHIKITYCGQRVSEFCFVDAEHMLNELKREGCLLPCPECKKVILKLLED